MKRYLKSIVRGHAAYVAGIVLFCGGTLTAFAQSTPTGTIVQNTVIDATSLVPHVAIFLSPPTQSVLQGGTFDVSLYLDTKKKSVNTLDLTITFPPDKLQIVDPSVGATSLIQLWLQPPTYSNAKGTVRLTGVIPNGIVTSGGIITTFEFKAIGIGQAAVTITPDSSVLANDGLGSAMTAEFQRGIYTIAPQPPAGPLAFSLTHPVPSAWYDDPNPAIGWQATPGANEYFYSLTADPYTVPDANAPMTTGTTASFAGLKDGRWYFHLRALSSGAWGATTHLPVQIDTSLPAAFTPTVDIVPGTSDDRVLVSFFTTDALSGIDHYEVAVINRADAASIGAPVFTETQSPYEFTAARPGNYRVIVRAFDRAGNVRESTADVSASTPIVQYIKERSTPIIIGLLLFIIFLFLLHYFLGHKLLRRAHRILVAIQEENRAEDVKEAEETMKEEGPQQ